MIVHAIMYSFISVTTMRFPFDFTVMFKNSLRKRNFNAQYFTKPTTTVKTTNFTDEYCEDVTEKKRNNVDEVYYIETSDV